jgi:hypothetical protein
MAPSQHVISSLGQLADDFFITVLLLKSSDPQNMALPFLHAHVLELSGKAACHALSASMSGLSNGHDIMGIYQCLAAKLPAVTTVLPTTSQMLQYPSVWFRPDGSTRDIELPPPDELDALELCYFIDNAMDLKYGFTKRLDQISGLHIPYAEINSRFLGLFRTSRDAYADADLNTRMKQRLYGPFGKSPETDRKLLALLGI